MGMETASVLTEGRTPSQLRDSGGLGDSLTALSLCEHPQGGRSVPPSVAPLLPCSDLVGFPWVVVLSGHRSSNRTEGMAQQLLRLWCSKAGYQPLLASPSVIQHDCSAQWIQAIGVYAHDIRRKPGAVRAISDPASELPQP